METEPITVRTDKQTIKQLDTLAAQTDRSRNYLVNQAIDEFLALRRYQIQKIQQGIASADRGEFVAHDGVFAKLSAKRAARRVPKKK
jgi:predicted transcriptional regulator